MKKIVLYGIGNDFDRFWKKIMFYREKGIVEIVASVDKRKAYDERLGELSSPDILHKIDFDFVIINTCAYYEEIRSELIWNGIDAEKICYGGIFAQKFEVGEHIFDKKFRDTFLIGNSIHNAAYEDVERIFYGENLKITLGRKSSIGESKVERGECEQQYVIDIGNFSNISWDCRFCMGLNLDHDYNRVTNYGFTHLFDDYHMDSNVQNRIIVGSDVWIGRGVYLKSNIQVGDGAVIAAESVVVKDVPPYAIVGGNPAQIIKYRFDEKTIRDLLEIQWWNWELEKILNNAYLLEDVERFVQKFKG